jgi:hypothetical protein
MQQFSLWATVANFGAYRHIIEFYSSYNSLSLAIARLLLAGLLLGLLFDAEDGSKFDYIYVYGVCWFRI